MLVDYCLGICRNSLLLTIAGVNRKVKQRRFFHGQVMKNILSVRTCVPGIGRYRKRRQGKSYPYRIASRRDDGKTTIAGHTGDEKYFGEKSTAADTPDAAALRVKVAAVGGLRDDGFAGERRHTTTRC